MRIIIIICRCVFLSCTCPLSRHPFVLEASKKSTCIERSTSNLKEIMYFNLGSYFGLGSFYEISAISKYSFWSWPHHLVSVPDRAHEQWDSTTLQIPLCSLAGYDNLLSWLSYELWLWLVLQLKICFEEYVLMVIWIVYIQIALLCILDWNNQVLSVPHTLELHEDTPTD